MSLLVETLLAGTKGWHKSPGTKDWHKRLAQKAGTKDWHKRLAQKPGHKQPVPSSDIGKSTIKITLSFCQKSLFSICIEKN